MQKDTIGCTIRGLRRLDQRSCAVNARADFDDRTRKLVNKGCKYRVPRLTLIEFLSHFGDLKSDIEEKLFNDGGTSETDGTHRTQNYTVKIKLKKEISNILPIIGKRIKITYLRHSEALSKLL
jgi:hypothetical protein